MHKIIFSSVIAVFMLTGFSYADVYVVHNNGVIYSLSEQNDAVVPKGYSVKVIKGTIDELGLTRPVDEYKFDGSKFKPDTVKIKEKEDRVIEENKKVDAKKSVIISAKEKIISSVKLTNAEFDAIFGEKE